MFLMRQPPSISGSQSTTIDTGNGGLGHTQIQTPSVSTTAAEPLTPGQSPDFRMLLTSKGEKVYIGATASLSFLQFLREKVRQCIGSTDFTDGHSNNIMFEAELEGDATMVVDEDLEESRPLIECFLEATSGILDVFSSSEVEMLWRQSCEIPAGSVSSSPSVEADLAPLYMAIAIGAQFRASSDADRHLASSYLRKVQKLAFEGMLYDTSLSMVRLFTLMAFYMMGACRRNTAAIYLGVASKAAVALGLHMTTARGGILDEEHRTRLRLWHSLRTLDTVANSILGRPGSLPLVRVDYLEGSEANQIGNGNQTVQAVATACSLLDEIIQNLGGVNKIDILQAEEALVKLRAWSRTLPVDLRRFPCHDSACATSADRQFAFGILHVSCVYYFTVILVTRPFLTVDLVGRLKPKPRYPSTHPADLVVASKVSKLSQVCLTSALYMAEICDKYASSCLLIGNFCFVKAWVFGAGLVLGFAIFAGESRSDIKHGFTRTCEVLRGLACMSPQAKHYFEILSRFSEDIGRYRQRRDLERRKVIEQYLDKILDLDVVQPLESQYSPAGQSWATTGAGRPRHAMTMSETEPFNFDALLDMSAGGPDVPWDDMSQLSAANLPDYDPFSMFFDGTE
ncbi:hypothetical protein H2204_004848 [Knufia peltigerae]|uniref:Xylanolytic transcriptional activator regulatory domain-containing protein n=1 Tax=Knufia peltigerae TaxID=1002370 RepID=A0AA38Y6L0_9EURO|nr:hypothetical protein H2204_004848 [Knufia peltigerae]